MTAIAKGIFQTAKDPIKTFQLVQIVRQGTLVLCSILLARSHFSVEQIGAYEWLVYLGYLLSFFWIAGFLQGILTATGIKEAIQRAGFLWSAFYLYLIFSTLSFVAFVGIGYFIKGIYQIEFLEYTAYGMWLLLSAISMLLPNILYITRQNGKLHFFNILYFLGLLSVFSIIFFNDYDLKFLLFYLNIFGAFLAIWAFREFYDLGYHPFNGAQVIKCFIGFWPLCIYAFLGGMAIVFDGWLVHYIFGDGAIFAIYKYGSREFPLSVAVAAALSNAMIPVIAASFTDGLKVLRQRSLRMMHLLFPGSILLLMSSTWIFSALYGDRFLEAVIIFDIMILAVCSRMLFPQAILIAQKDNKILLRVSVFEMLINIGLSVGLVMVWGLPGIVIATIIAYLFEKIILALYLKSRYQIRLNDYTHVFFWAFYSLFLVGVFVMKYWII